MTEITLTYLDTIQERIYQAQTASGGCDGYSICRGAGLTWLDVSAGHPLYDESFRCVCQRAQGLPRRIAMMARISVPTHYRECSFDWLRALSPAAQKGKGDAWTYCAAWPNGTAGRSWVYLHGLPGTGKTGLAAAMAMGRIEHCTDVRWLDYYDWQIQLLDTQSRGRDDDGPTYRELIQDAMTAPVLVLDDFGDMEATTAATEFQRKNVYIVLQARLAERRPTIFTSNLRLEHVATVFGPRVARRIEEMAMIFELTGTPLHKVQAASAKVPRTSKRAPAPVAASMAAEAAHD